MDYDIEKGLISKLIETKDIKTIKDYQIKPQFFMGESKRIYAYIQKHIHEIGNVPTARVLENKFPSYSLYSYECEDGKRKVGTEEELSFWCIELRNKVKHNKLVDLVETAADDLNDLNTEKAFTKLRGELAVLDADITITDSVLLNEQGEERKQAYLEKVNSGGLLGISTGLDYLDSIIKGLINGCLITIVASTGVGKAQPVDTPVLTLDGYKRMGYIKSGDYVINCFGEPKRVARVFPQGKKEVYRVSFEDGTSTLCCKEHLWMFKTTNDSSWRVNTLENICNEHPLKCSGKWHLHIPINAPIVAFNSKGDTYIEPYIMGLFLGNGKFVTEEIKYTDLKDIMESTGKFIPQCFLYANIEKRKDLLMGLMDSCSGSVSSKGSYLFDAPCDTIIKDFVFLCNSLGYRCKKVYNKTKRKVQIKILTRDLIVRSERSIQKLIEARVEYGEPEYPEHLSIVAIDKVGEEECQCLLIDSPDHTYLCNDFIVTHNTWFEVLLGANCLLQSCKVAHFVTEMSTSLMQDRYDALLFSKTHSKGMNYKKFKMGKLSPEMQEEYFDFLDNEYPKLESIWVESATGVMALEQRVKELSPDVVLVDAVYLMEDDQNAKDDWLRVAHITRDLKKMCKRLNMPVIINTQLDENTAKKVSPKLGDIKYTQAVGQDSDIVIALYRDEVMINDKEMGLSVLKNREGEGGKITLNWDFTCMNLSEIYAELPNGEDDGEIGSEGSNTLSIDDME